MTNKEAAEFIWDVLDGVKSFNEKDGRGLEALNLAIKALKNERPQYILKVKNLTAEDKKHFQECWNKSAGGLLAIPDNYEIVPIEIPQGEWIVDENNDLLNFMKCSNCGEVAEWLDGGSQFLSKFCPNCGAQMKGGAE